MNSLYNLRLSGEARDTGDAGSPTQSRVLAASEGRSQHVLHYPWALSTGTFAQESEHQRTDLIPEEHRALTGNAESSVPANHSRVGLIISGSHYLIH